MSFFCFQGDRCIVARTNAALQLLPLREENGGGWEGGTAREPSAVSVALGPPGPRTAANPSSERKRQFF